MASPSGPIGARTDEGPAHTPTVRDHVFTAGLAGRLPCARGLARRSPRRIAAGSYAAGLVTPPRLSPSSRATGVLYEDRAHGLVRPLSVGARLLVSRRPLAHAHARGRRAPRAPLTTQSGSDRKV